MLKSIASTLLAACLLLTAAAPTEAGDNSSKSKTVRIGAVAYAPNVVTVFRGVKRYLNKHGFQSDYVLYSNYDAMVAALKKGEIEIAWNTPLAHAKYHVACGGKSKALVMRDVDRDYRSVVIARVDSGIESAKQLPGRKLVIGSYDSAEATVLPLYYLKKQGIDAIGSKTVCLHNQVDFKGNPCCSPRHVLEALKKGRGEAGIVGERMWNAIQRNQKKTGKSEFRLVWKSPAFSHCVFTAADDFDEKQAQRFKKLMLSMSPKDPSTSAVMRLEGTKKWLPGTQSGFEDLFQAVKERSK